MNILVVYTHPNHESLNYAFLEKTIEGITNNEKNINLEVLDLYKENFNPALYFDKDVKRRHMNEDSETKKTPRANTVG